MNCFGYYDENVRVCAHCWVSRQCKSIRVTHTEELEAAVLEQTIAEATVVEGHPLLRILEALDGPMALSKKFLADALDQGLVVPVQILSELD